jgi:outer membrane protein assembly factor BamE (lipoprotein component of BamABCDE complex)
MNLPKILGRKACRQCFTNISEATWDYLFDTEKHNGLFKCRTKGPDLLVYYDAKKILNWMFMKGYYTPDEFSNEPKSNNIYSALIVRTHRMTR